MATLDHVLPTEEELTVEEVNLGTSLLMAGANHLGKYCEYQNNEYLLCKSELKDPRKCLNEGKAVTACSLEFFRNVKKLCLQEFNQYATCIDKSSSSYDYSVCRRTQSVFDKCMLDEMNLPRPSFGYFTEVKVHNTKRPKPEPEPIPHYPDTPAPVPEAVKPKYGHRGIFQS
ncbi:NADH dehydrogenase [ubiquinone] 1 alpha subcomplex subunit 8 [Cephus cinctus]|uniref:NADH dehydrogenase [ubiquinone] 1 alpha subcomplex subunit 8 n=1 Tax=Cephus cinctus TaxID=211228 RepID=A0AAJ7FR86_CEPCN|nr:NADH dehydrogenase [ubiquinone] 1 alpha subcomplex subunit 8 [Cephus cinctus]